MTSCPTVGKVTSCLTVTMAQIFNLNSFLFIGLSGLLLLAAILVRRRVHYGLVIWLIAVLVLGAGWLLLRTGAGVQLDSVEAYEAAIASGRPTLVEFYSDY